MSTMSPKFKRFLKLVLFILVFEIILILFFQYIQFLKDQVGINYKSGLYRFIISVFPILLGAILNLPYLFTQFRNEGNWKIDFVKLISVGIPTITISFLPILFFTPIGEIYSPLLKFDYKSISMISGLVLGFTILDSFKKFS